MILDDCTRAAQSGESLSENDAAACLRWILQGVVGDEEIAALLIALSEKGETADEVVGFCRALLENCVPVALDSDAIDVCGTGGSGLVRFNVSTAAAFVLAAGGVPVAKHGNRGSRRPNGSFDLLDALHCPFELRSKQLVELFQQTGLCFIYARAYHPLMKAVVGARKLANRRTIFNMAAPLCNPARPQSQVVGTPDRANSRLIADVLQRLGRRKSIVVTGDPGVDEVSVSGETHLLTVLPESQSSQTIHPSDFGIERHDYDSIPGGDAAVNAVVFRSLLAGDAPDPIVDMVCLSGAVAMHCHGIVDSIETGLQTCRDLLKSGAVAAKFEEFRSASASIAN